MSVKNNYHKKENKNVKALFSVVCLCIIALGMIVYFSSNPKKQENNPVNENQTLEVTTEVQHAVTITETTAAAEESEAQTQKAKKKSRAKTTTAEPSTMESGESNTPYKSYYKYPLTEVIERGYSEELTLDETMGDFRAHPAVDFKGQEDDEVVAVNDGIVTDVYTDNLSGQVVEIDHGGKLVAKYCGLKSVAVKKGQRLNIGNKIGTLGKVPAENSLATHLHFETKLDGKYVNPLDVMGKTE